MSRLTIKDSNGYCLKCCFENGKPNVKEHANKLGQLEDIEEELGIDLITLFKALKNGVYFKVIPRNAINKPIEFDKGFVDLQAKEIRVNTYYSYPDYINGSYKLAFKDYGKTWALERRELE